MRKALIISVVVVALGLIIWFLATNTPEERYFKPLTFQNTNFVVNETGKSYLDTIVRVGLDHLNIANTQVLIKVLTPETRQALGSEFELKAHIREYANGYIIWIDEMSRDQAIEVLSHELIHLAQYYSDQIVYENGVVFWKGEPIEATTIPYESRPWEVAAFIGQDSLKEDMLRTLY